MQEEYLGGGLGGRSQNNMTFPSFYWYYRKIILLMILGFDSFMFRVLMGHDQSGTPHLTARGTELWSAPSLVGGFKTCTHSGQVFKSTLTSGLVKPHRFWGCPFNLQQLRKSEQARTHSCWVNGGFGESSCQSGSHIQTLTPLVMFSMGFHEKCVSVKSRPHLFKERRTVTQPGTLDLKGLQYVFDLKCRHWPTRQAHGGYISVQDNWYLYASMYAKSAKAGQTRF